MLGSIIDVLRLAFFLVEFNHILAVFFFSLLNLIHLCYRCVKWVSLYSDCGKRQASLACMSVERLCAMLYGSSSGAVLEDKDKVQHFNSNALA